MAGGAGAKRKEGVISKKRSASSSADKGAARAAKKRKEIEETEARKKDAGVTTVAPRGMPSAAEAPRKEVDKSRWATEGKPHIVIILESAGIAITDLGRKKNQVLQHDKDGAFLDAKGQPTWLFRPDIVHQTLLAIYDMPLCKEGHVKVYINTIKNKAIEVAPTTRIPRTFKRFCGLVSQLIDTGKVVNPETDQPLFKVLPYPVRQNVPEGANVYGLCWSEYVDPVNHHAFVRNLKIPKRKDRDPVAYFVVPCRDNALWPDEDEGFGDYITEKLCVTQYETSAVTLIHKISNAFERYWQV